MSESDDEEELTADDLDPDSDPDAWDEDEEWELEGDDLEPGFDEDAAVLEDGEDTEPPGAEPVKEPPAPPEPEKKLSPSKALKFPKMGR